MKIKNVCTYCQQLIKDLVIICKECQNFLLCFQCFRLGAEIGKHKYTHKFEYNVTNLPIFSVKNAWNAIEEIKLLDAIEHYGLGNWEGISGAFNNKRSPEEIAEHFEKFYIDGNIGKETLQSVAFTESVGNRDDGCSNIEMSTNNIYGNAIGYMPLRDDYEREYLNTAEMSIKDLHYEPTDDNLEIRCKYALYDNFCRVLKERQKHKNFAKEYNMVQVFFEQNFPHRGKDTSNGGDFEIEKFKEKIYAMAHDLSGKNNEIVSIHDKTSINKGVSNSSEPYRTPTPTLLKTFQTSLFAPNSRSKAKADDTKSIKIRPKSFPDLSNSCNRLRNKYKRTKPKSQHYLSNRKRALRSTSNYIPQPDDNARDSLNLDNELDLFLDAEEFLPKEPENTKQTGCHDPSSEILTSSGFIDWDNEICATLKPFARFYKMSDFVELCTNIIEYQRVKARLEDLKECRKFGITKLKDADRFITEYLIPLNQEKSKRENNDCLTNSSCDTNLSHYTEADASRENAIIKEEERSSFSSNSSLLSEGSSNDTAGEPYTYKNMTFEERKHDAIAKNCPNERSYRPIGLEKKKRDKLVNFLRDQGLIQNLS